MVSKKFFLNICLFTMCLFSKAASIPIISKNTSILIISIPKSGTHLLDKCIKLLTDLPTQCTHLKCDTKNKESVFSQTLKKFFIYRDPRDQILSFIFFMDAIYSQWAGLFQQIHQNNAFYVQQFNQRSLPIYPTDYVAYANMSFNDRIVEFIIDASLVYDRMGSPHIELIQKSHGVASFYASYLGWQEIDEFCTVKFEDLIGPLGGGSSDKQIACILKIAKHLGRTITVQEAQAVASTLFGNSPTFREGKIGSWKKYFTEMHKQIFKKVAGQLLLDLEYEKDLNW